jgi:hypothetical protein
MTVQSLGYWGENVDLHIRQGATFGTHRLRLKQMDGTPFPLTGCTPSGQIRRTAASSTVVASLSFSVADEAGGLLDMSLTDEATAAIVAAELPEASDSRYVYDVHLATADGRVIPVAWGAVIVLRRVTRAA